MQEHYDRLGISAQATPAEIKAAYHAQLKAYPAHSHPQDFKAIRAAYEVLSKAPQSRDDFFELKPIEAEIDAAVVAQLRSQAEASLVMTLEEFIVLTF